MQCNKITVLRMMGIVDTITVQACYVIASNRPAQYCAGAHHHFKVVCVTTVSVQIQWLFRSPATESSSRNSYYVGLVCENHGNFVTVVVHCVDVYWVDW